MSILTDFNPSFLPFSLVRDVYIETGVCEGESLINAAGAVSPIMAMDGGFGHRQFREMRCIELCDRHVLACGDNLRNCGFVTTIPSSPTADNEYHFTRGAQRVRLRCESSIRGLPALLTDLPRDCGITAWLDAHFPGEHDDEWEPCDGQSVLLEEIRIILSYYWAVSPVLVIDDALQFEDAWWDQYGAGFPKFIREQWPTMQQIRDLLDPAGYGMLLNHGILYAWREPWTD